MSVQQREIAMTTVLTILLILAVCAILGLGYLVVAFAEGSRWRV